MAGRPIPGPSSASHSDPSSTQYGGSRSLATRFRYKNPNSLSAFVELSPLYVATPDQLYEWLNACQLVERVEWQSSKASQGNVGNHLSQRSIKVFPKRQRAGSATQQFLEFTVTRHGHMSKNATCPYTVSVVFKDPPWHLVPRAWGILRHVCHGKELFPNKVNEWMKDALENYASQEQEDAQEEEEPAPGSASAEPNIL